MVLRALAASGRATVKTLKQLEAEAAAVKAAEAAAKLAAMGPPLTLEEAMEAAGLLRGEVSPSVRPSVCP